jgi:hypothetical protein
VTEVERAACLSRFFFSKDDPCGALSFVDPGFTWTGTQKKSIQCFCNLCTFPLADLFPHEPISIMGNTLPTMGRLSWCNLGSNLAIITASVVLWRGIWHALDALEDEMGWDKGSTKWKFGLLLAAIGVIVLVNMDPTMTTEQPSANAAFGHLYAGPALPLSKPSSSSKKHTQ